MEVRGGIRIQGSSEEEARRARERAFDAGLISKGGIVALGVENVFLVDFVKPGMTRGVAMEGNRRGIQVDLNVPVNMDDEGSFAVVQQIRGMKEVQQVGDEVQEVMVDGEGYHETQDSDPFQLGLIIKAISRDSRRRKRRIEEMDEVIDGTTREVSSIGNK